MIIMSKTDTNAIIEQLQRIEDKVDEMYLFYSNGKFTVKLIKWIFYTLVAIGGAFVMIKTILK